MDFFGDNDDVADRVREERQRRGWTYRELADRMAQEGCAIAPSTLQRMEKGSAPGKPRPKIGVEELVAACRVFGLQPAEMLESRESRFNAQATALVSRRSEALAAIERAVFDIIDTQRAFTESDPPTPTDGADLLVYWHRTVFESDQKKLVNALSRFGHGIPELAELLVSWSSRVGALIGFRRSGHPQNDEDATVGWPSGLHGKVSMPDWETLAAAPDWGKGIDVAEVRKK